MGRREIHRNEKTPVRPALRSSVVLSRSHCTICVHVATTQDGTDHPDLPYELCHSAHESTRLCRLSPASLPVPVRMGRTRVIRPLPTFGTRQSAAGRTGPLSLWRIPDRPTGDGANVPSRIAPMVALHGYDWLLPLRCRYPANDREQVNVLCIGSQNVTATTVRTSRTGAIWPAGSSFVKALCTASSVWQKWGSCNQTGHSQRRGEDDLRQYPLRVTGGGPGSDRPGPF